MRSHMDHTDAGACVNIKWSAHSRPTVERRHKAKALNSCGVKCCSFLDLPRVSGCHNTQQSGGLMESNTFMTICKLIAGSSAEHRGRAECTAESRAKKHCGGSSGSRWPRLNPSFDLRPKRINDASKTKETKGG